MTPRPQPARLSAGDHGFNGTEIDRARPLQFRLNGRTIAGFSGDSVLSATLASGITEAGHFEGTPLALSERFCPAIVPSGSEDGAAALPMDRTPAIDGAEWQTVDPGPNPSGLATLFGNRASLGLRWNAQTRLLRPWQDIRVETATACDLVIVGGGVAGMSAAVAAGRLGLHVALVERQPRLGGNSAMFGTVDGEESPADAVIRLTKAIGALSNISVFCRAEALRVRPGWVELHIVELNGTEAVGHTFALSPRAIILATGTHERLPVFSGNRLPGVATALAAYELACRYGIWPGTSAILATVASAPYRLATQARDAGINFHRLVDVRPNPQSRFIEFTKAYGLTQVSGTRVQAATQARRGLEIGLVPDHASPDTDTISFAADRLIVCGGFQPALALWLNAGGSAYWAPERNRLEAGSGPEGIVLAGSAAGWLSRKACQDSGVDAVNVLFKRKRQPVTDLAVDPLYETPDAATPVRSLIGSLPAFLDQGDSLIAEPPVKASRANPLKRKAEAWQLADAPKAFGLIDVAAGVQLGAIAPEHAGQVAMERTGITVNLSAFAAGASLETQGEVSLVPSFLKHRYGSDASVWKLSTDLVRHAEVGSLLYINSDETDPLRSIGVIVGTGSDTNLALVGRMWAEAGRGVTVRDQGQILGARLVAPATPQA